MAKSPYYKANNEGGYGNPPLKNQFNGKPGPGRPKGSKNGIDAALRMAYNEPMEVIDKVTKKRRRIDPNVAIANRSVQLGVTGRSHDNARAIELSRKYGPGSSDERVTAIDLSLLSDVELQFYGLLAWRLEKSRDVSLLAAEEAQLMQFARALIEMAERNGWDAAELEQFVNSIEDENGDNEEQSDDGH